MRYQTLSIVMPSYNERATLRSAVERVLKAGLPLPVELIVVDDGSPDGSPDTVMDLARSRQIRLFRHARNRGKGAAVRTGIRVATGDLLGVLDADLEYDPQDFRGLLEPILAGEARVSYGTRAFGAHTAFSFWYVVGNKFINLAASFLFDTWLSDLSTCLKVADTELWRSLHLRSEGFQIDAEATAKFLKAGERIFEVPITYRARSRAEGKKVRPSDGLRHLLTLVRVRFSREVEKPLRVAAPIEGPGFKALDRFLQRWRFVKARSFVSLGDRVLDIGCLDGALFRYLGPVLGRGVGIDPSLQDRVIGDRYKLVPGHVPQDLPLGEQFDVVTMLAVVEHLPEDAVRGLVSRLEGLLVPGGRIVITVPSPAVDRILHWLDRLALISGHSIHEHHGFDPDRVPELFGRNDLRLRIHERFQLGLNNLFVFEKAR